MRLKESVASNNSITFLVNGKKVTANNPDPQMSLNEFLRTRTQTRGVKLSCGEGGCGSCLVLLSAPAPGDPSSIIHWSVNSCLKPLCAVDGMAVTSAEGIGNTKTGFHAIQQKLAAANGSQCGFCTPGMCTQMFALLQNEPNPTQEQIEDNFDGNLCRCTGYRPILESMRSFAQPTTKQSSPCCDIEDLGCKDKNICSKTKAVDPEVDKFEEGMKKFFASYQPAKDKTLVDDGTGVMWLQPTTIPELFQFMQQYPEHKLIAGNTSIGIYKDELSSVMIELENIPDLCVNTSDKTGVTIGSAVPIANFIKTMQQILQNNKGYQTAAFPSMLAHLQRIASHPIRNTATVGGNLMVEQKHEDFPSDMFTVLATVESIVTIATSATSTIQVPLYQINDIDMSNKVLVSIYIPFGQVNEYYQSYKVSLRKQNSHAIVNGGFKFTVVNQIIVKAVIVYAGAKHKNTRALKTEQLLLNQGLNRQTLQLALVSLAQEMSIEVTNRQAYRASLVQSLFYKYFLWLISQFSSLAPPLQSGSTTLVRPLSQATQVFPDGEVAEYPLSFPIEKLTAKTQGSGEAVYTEDIVPPLNTVFAAFVLSTKAKATILSVDISKAKQSPGFIDYISYSDVPGMNDVGEVVNDEPLFAQTETMYYGQAIGLVICDSTRHAHMASQLVVVNYQDSPTPPILSIQDAIQANSFYNGTDTNPFAFKVITRGDLNTGFSQAKHILEGEVYTGGQAAFYMEAQNCLVVPPSMGDETAAFMVYSSTQNLSDVQAKVCRVLNIPQQNVVVKVPLVGGAFGAKITRSNIVATAACVAANKLGVPVRCILDRNTDMTMLGNRHPFLAKYKVGFDDQGTIIALDLKVYSNAGCTYDVSLGVHLLAQLASDNAYFVPNWRSEAFACRTNMASNTSVRTFGTIQSIFIIENILEDVARYLNIDAYIVKQTNFYKVGQVTPYNQPITQDDYTLPAIWQNMLKAADYVNRVQQVKTFNSQNRWVKKGIAISPLKYGLAYAGVQAGAFINVYGDGTVIVNHSGCEIGQGINTKVAQAVAYKLQIPLTSINVNVTATDKVPFSTGTGGSIASECCVAAANIACEELLARVASFKGQTWADTIGNALGNGVNLSVTALSYSGNMEMQQLAGFAKRNVRLPKGPDGQTLTVFVGTDKVKDNTPGPFAYNTFAACCTEVELDVLTGEYQILRADIQFDCGVSMNPLIDIGQIEGGFVMGLGNFLTEEMLYNDDGSVITNGTWEYKIPCSFTIPIEFNVNLLPNASNPNGIYNSKAVGEPPMTLSASVVFALKHAISAARQDGGDSGNFRLDTPVTIEKAQQTCSISSQQYYI